MADRRFCENCGKENRAQAKFCGHCGNAIEEISEWVEEEQPKRMPRETSEKLFFGSFYILLALIIYLWASRHSPYMGFGEMLMAAVKDPDHGIYEEEPYAVLIFFISVLGLVGVIQLMLGIISYAKE